jgi:hypothetical protein
MVVPLKWRPSSACRIAAAQPVVIIVQSVLPNDQLMLWSKESVDLGLKEPRKPP